MATLPPLLLLLVLVVVVGAAVAADVLSELVLLVVVCCGCCCCCCCPCVADGCDVDVDGDARCELPSMACKMNRSLSLVTAFGFTVSAPPSIVRNLVYIQCYQINI